MSLKIKDIQKFRGNKLGFFRFKKLGEDFLITTDIGRYAFLSEKDFGLLVSGELDKLNKIKKEELESIGIIKTSDYEDKMVEGYAKKNHYLNQGPSLHIVVVTLRCNHKCKYCHAAAAPESAKSSFDMDETTAKKVVDTIFFTTSNAVNIEFQGGEPLLNFEIVKFITEYAEEKAKILDKRLYLSVVSNLSLMTDEILDYFVAHDFGVSTSLDGDEELHNLNRTYKPGNSFKETAKWIKKINKVYKANEDKLTKAKVGAILTVTKDTLKKPVEIVDTYISLGLDSVFLRPLNPYGFAASDLKNLGYSSDDFFDF
ncbi:MAG: radical SAM protein, partial [Candidatus Gracilibacteria bacterium]|nr:radical SAM protein [Candidatus Gracilibacteria bacterium]